MSDLKTLLKTEPILTKDQQLALTVGPAALMDPLDAYKLGWRMALSHVRYALAPEQVRLTPPTNEEQKHLDGLQRDAALTPETGE